MTVNHQSKYYRRLAWANVDGILRVDRLVDIRPMIKARTEIRDHWPIKRLERLRSLLASEHGDAHYHLSFGIDRWANRFVDVTVTAQLDLQCQRSMVVFSHRVDQQQRLGLLDDPSDEAALPEGYEPCLLTDHSIRLIDLVEDELILAVPLVPIAPGSELDFSADAQDDSSSAACLLYTSPSPRD